jgi:hypothetical protein
VHCESRDPVAVVRGQFGNPEEAERPPLEVGTGGLLKGQQTGKPKYVYGDLKTV